MIKEIDSIIIEPFYEYTTTYYEYTNIISVEVRCYKCCIIKKERPTNFKKCNNCFGNRREPLPMNEIL